MLSRGWISLCSSGRCPVLSELPLPDGDGSSVRHDICTSGTQALLCLGSAQCRSYQGCPGCAGGQRRATRPSETESREALTAVAPGAKQALCPHAQSSFFLLIAAGFRVKAAQRYLLQPFWQGSVGLASCFLDCSQSGCVASWSGISKFSCRISDMRESLIHAMVFEETES